MRSESVKVALYDIRDNILLAGEFVEGLTSQEFGESRLHLYAVTRALEIISEASRWLPDDIRDKHPELTGTNTATSLRPMSGKRDGASSALLAVSSPRSGRWKARSDWFWPSF